MPQPSCTIRIEPEAQQRFGQIFAGAANSPADEKLYEKTYTQSPKKSKSASGKVRRARKSRKLRSRKNVDTRSEASNSSQHLNVPTEFVLCTKAPTPGASWESSDDFSDYSVALTDMSLDSHYCDELHEDVNTALALLEKQKELLANKIRISNADTKRNFEKVMAELSQLRIHYKKLRKAYAKTLSKLDEQHKINVGMTEQIDLLAKKSDKQEEDIKTKSDLLEENAATMKVDQAKIQELTSQLKAFEQSLARLELTIAKKSEELAEKREKNEEYKTLLLRQNGEVSGLKREVEKLESKVAEAQDAKHVAVSELETQQALWFERQKTLESAVEDARQEKKKLEDSESSSRLLRAQMEATSAALTERAQKLETKVEEMHAKSTASTARETRLKEQLATRGNELQLAHDDLDTARQNYVEEKKKHKATAEQKRAAEQDCKIKDQALAKWQEWRADSKAEIAALRKELDDLKERNAELGKRNEILHKLNDDSAAQIKKKDTEIKSLKTNLREEQAENDEQLDRIHTLERKLRAQKDKLSEDVRKYQKSHAKSKELVQRQKMAEPVGCRVRRGAEEDQREISLLRRMLVDQKSPQQNNLTVPMGNVSPSPMPPSSYESSPERTPDRTPEPNAEDLASVAMN